MNLFDSSFLCLDIGTAVVRGVAHRVRGARIVRSAVATAECGDNLGAAIMTVVDSIEGQLGTRFNSAFVTGNFGDVAFAMTTRPMIWRGPHKITVSDMRSLVAGVTSPDGFNPMHIIPLRYQGATLQEIPAPVGKTDTAILAIFGVISYSRAQMAPLFDALRRAHLQINGIFDPMLLMAAANRPENQTVMIIDMGAAYTSAAIWKRRGPVAYVRIPRGQTEISRAIADAFDIGMDDASRVRQRIPTTVIDKDRFTPADAMFAFTRADAADITNPIVTDILDELNAKISRAREKHNPVKIFLAGGGADIDGIDNMIGNVFDMPVKNLGGDAALRALSDMVWTMQTPRINKYNARRDWFARIAGFFAAPLRMRPRPPRPKKQNRPIIPILPSTLAFDMHDDNTYGLFQSAGISMIHVDIMDGFFVNRVTGGIDELKYIRSHTRAHLMVHLMTDNPVHWAIDAINAGANTIIVSAPTAGVRDAIAEIHRHGRRAGIALGPDMSMNSIKKILRDIDDVLVMSVRPGAGGQEFMPGALRRIAILNATRKRYNLKFKITVDGGINADTAKQCWAAGADYLVAGSYLARATDFPLAVQRLMPRRGGI